MDFYRLPRRTLQLLCKRNKIHANLTNFAMAQSLRSLHFVEDLDEILQQSQGSSIKYPTRPSNPPRSCRSNTSLIISSLPKRRRAKKLEDDDDEEEEAPLKKMPALNTLVPCDEKSAGLKTYQREMCTPSVRRNGDTTLASEESAVGVAVEYAALGKEKRRSIGVQVDVNDISDGLLEIEATRWVDLIKEDHETNSCILLASDARDKECVESWGMQDVQVYDPLPEPCPKATNVEDTASHHVPTSENFEDGLGASVDIQNNNEKGDDMDKENELGGDNSLLKVEGNRCTDEEPNLCTLPINDGMQNVQADDPFPEGSPKATNKASTASVEDDEMNHISVLENNEYKLNVAVAVQSKNAEGDEMNMENEASKSDGGKEVEVKIKKQNKKKKDLDGFSLRKLRALYKKKKEIEVIQLEKTEEEVKREEREVKLCEENKARLDGLSLRKLKNMYKNKVTKQQ